MTLFCLQWRDHPANSFISRGYHTMSIQYIEDQKQFLISTCHTTYAFDVYHERYLRHLYYGKKATEVQPPQHPFVSFAPYRSELDPKASPDILSQEYAFFGSGDFRTAALRLNGPDGTGVTDFVYDSYRIFDGRSEPEGLPFSRADEHTQTLEVILLDPVLQCRLHLFYTVFEQEDVISRYMALENRGDHAVTIQKCMSLTLDLERNDLDMVSFYGIHNHELKYQRVALHHGMQSVFSRRGASSHQYNPFFALCSHGATEERGEVYGFNFVYSGSFLDEVEVDQLNHTRVQTGLGSENFAHTLNPGDCFTSPEAVMTYSAVGFGCMTRNFHAFIRSHILPPSALRPHPIVLNTWEACYFDIDESLLLKFAKESQKLGFDMLVMDDGWFGKRDHDRAGLGDWIENRKKFPNGLRTFVNKIRSVGIRFGIWIEPEMVNPDSDLYRAHPDWCLHVPGRDPALSRNQLVLDMSNPAVVEHLMTVFDRTFDGVPIDYFKWDMNRHLCDVGSAVLPPERQQEVPFRYMKGVYRLLNWFAERFPNAIIETCSGGGGRYDLGMMCYGVQIWTSDNTDPYDRTMIQSSALLAYPAATMSCHVSDPHGVVRSLDYRYKVAVGGMLGYELNILNMSDEIKSIIQKQIAEYRTFEHLIRLGDYYELASPVRYAYSSYCYSSAARDEILLTLIEKKDCKRGKTKRLAVKPALTHATYTDIYTGKCYSGAELRQGITLPLTGTPDTAQLLYLKIVNRTEK